MPLTLRYIKLLMVASIGLLFTLFAFNNLTDSNANWPSILHVLSMDTIFPNPSIMWRAITHPFIQHIAFYLIITWQILTALFCWIGCFRLLRNVHASDMQFNQAKTTAFIGLFFAFALHMIGFITIGGEWFCMWQSSTWNAQATAGLYVSLTMLVMIFLALP